MTEQQWMMYYQKFAPAHAGSLHACPNYLYGLNQIRGHLSPPPPLTPNEKFEKRAMEIQAERLAIDKYKKDVREKEERNSKEQIEEAQKRLEKVFKRDPKAEKEFAEEWQKVKMLKEKLKNKHAAEKERLIQSSNPIEEFCFPAGTAILTHNGTFAIETLEAGDEVMANDSMKLLCVSSQIKAVYEHTVTELVEISFGETSFRTTPNHRFYSIETEEFISAELLQVGDRLLRVSGESITILGLEILTLEDPIKVYNLRVSDYGNYFVGPYEVLTHNCDGFLEGASQSFEETIAGIRDAILHPLDTAVELGSAVLHADEIVAQIASSVSELLRELPEYSVLYGFLKVRERYSSV